MFAIFSGITKSTEILEKKNKNTQSHVVIEFKLIYKKYIVRFCDRFQNFMTF